MIRWFYFTMKRISWLPCARKLIN